MRSTLGRRIFLAHLQLSYRLGRRVTLAEFGRLIAERLGRNSPFAATAVSKWEAGLQVPAPEVVEVIAELTGVDPGWISHGEKSAAPAPPLAPTESLNSAREPGLAKSVRGEGKDSAVPAAEPRKTPKKRRR